MKILNGLSLEEKIGQMKSLMGNVFIDNETGEWIGDENATDILKYGLGQITRLGGSTNLSPNKIAAIYNNIQRILMENTTHHIPTMNREECQNGYMIQQATVFPQSISAASTWNPNLVKQMCIHIRNQMRAVGACFAMAPVLDVTRDPRWGRVEETYGEDSYLVSQFGLAFIEGLQGDDLTQGVAACGKHFIAHGIPEGGRNWDPVAIGDRDLREIFCRPFELAINEVGLSSIMAAYHEIDGIPIHSSKKILKDLLREKLKFKGLVISDATGIETLHTYHKIASSLEQASIYAAEAGIDIELPYSKCYGDILIHAVQKGMISEELLNQRVKSILLLKYKLGLFDNPYVNEEKVSPNFLNTKGKEISQKIAQKSIILLKNSNHILPLSKELDSITIIGPAAKNPRYMLGDYAYPAHIHGINDSEEHFSSENEVKYTTKVKSEKKWEVSSFLDEIQKYYLPNTQIFYTKGFDINSNDKKKFDEALKITNQSSIIIIFLGDISGIGNNFTSGEMCDSATLNLPGVQTDFLKKLSKLNKKVIGVLTNGRPYSLEEIIPCFDALIEAWLPGEYGSEAILNVLTGNYNPSGKLPITFPRNVGQIPIYYNHKPSSCRSQFLGDYMDSSVSPLFPFGFGLSYSDFDIKNLEINKKEIKTDENFTISCLIKNIGDVSGQNTVQLYIRDEIGSVSRPIKELKGFCNVYLNPQEIKKITFKIPAGLCGFFNREMDFVVEPGEFLIMLGFNSRDIILQQQIYIKGEVYKYSRIPPSSSSTISETTEDEKLFFRSNNLNKSK